MNSKKVLMTVLCLVVILAGGIIICLWSNCTSQVPKTKKTKIAFVVPTLENPFFVDMTNAAITKSSQIPNLEIIVKASTKVEDALGQNQIIDDLIIQKVDVICIVPTNSEAIIPAIRKANAASIPIINIDNKVDMDKASKSQAIISTYIGSDNFEGGKLAGRYLVEKLEGKGKVAILEGVSGNDAAIKRKAGFLEALKDTDVKVVASQVANWNREQAFVIFQNILNANPDLNAAFACNDEMVLGASSALAQAKISKSKIVLIGFDAIKEAVDAVNMGQIDATIAQQPSLMGEKGVGLALDILAKRDVKKTYSTELKLIIK